jgi:two-component system, OmpR family, alkaline phosphatase synthesis response regulator PhoP
MTDPKTILVIDDEPGVVDVIRLHLQRKKYRVYTARDGEEGLRIAKTVHPDLVILDIMMPNKDGLEFYSDIITGKDRKLFPVLVLTERREFETLFKDVKADGFIPKPIDFDKLLAEVESIFRKASKVSPLKTTRSVLIVEDNDEVLPQILFAFARDGFEVLWTKTVEDIAERFPAKPVDLILAKLSLSNVVCTLKALPLLANDETAFLLYMPEGLDLNKEITKKICEQIGITPDKLIRMDNPFQLVKKSRELLG